VNKKSHKAAFTSRNKFTVILHRWWGFVDENGTRRKARCASVIDLVRSDDDVRGEKAKAFFGDAWPDDEEASVGRRTWAFELKA